MKVKEFQDKLNSIIEKENISPDTEIKIWTHYEVCAEDNGFWLSDSYSLENGIYAEYGGDVFHSENDLRQAVFDAHSSMDMPDSEIERIVEKKLSDIQTKKTINLFLRI